MSMDRNRDLFVAAFPYEDGRVLYVLKDPRCCPDCGRDVKLVIETDRDMPRCVPCAEKKLHRCEVPPWGDAPVGSQWTCPVCKSEHVLAIKASNQRTTTP